MTPTLQNGFVGNGLAYRLNAGRIEFTGIITRPSLSIAGATAFVLPGEGARKRPRGLTRVFVPAAENAQAALYQARILPTGELSFVVSSGGSAVAELNLGGLTFPV